MIDMGNERSGEFVDEHGYPTEWGIAQLRGFTGSPAGFVDMIRRLWWTPSLIDVAEAVNEDGHPVMRVRLATGGWSGNEEVVSEIDMTFFSVWYWQSSHRGALHIYDVPLDTWRTATEMIGSFHPGTEGDKRARPQLELVIVRDPDGDTDCTLFMDGRELVFGAEYDEYQIDAGRGYTYSDWIDARDRAVAAASPAAAARIAAAYDDPPGDQYIDDAPEDWPPR